MDMVRWGIMGPGRIAHRWMNGAMQVQNARICGVAGRTRENVDKFSRQYGIEHRYYSYEDMAKDSEVDCVYVATPHPSHKELAIMAIKNGKHVLVEKPIAVTEKDAAEMVSCAKENGVFLMEAVWTRFFSAVAAISKLLSSGRVGEVKSVHSAFSSRAAADVAPRLFDPMLAGGGLLDIGVYPLHFSDIVYGREPLDIFGYAAIGTDENDIGIDEQAEFISRYDNGAMSVMSCGIRVKMPDTAVIYATDAMITVPRFWSPTSFEVLYHGKGTEKFDNKVELTNQNYIDEGFQYEIRHVCECIRAGVLESPVMTHSKSLSVMRQCDALRKQWGLEYPFEKRGFGDNNE